MYQIAHTKQNLCTKSCVILRTHRIIHKELLCSGTEDQNARPVLKSSESIGGVIRLIIRRLCRSYIMQSSGLLGQDPLARALGSASTLDCTDARHAPGFSRGTVRHPLTPSSATQGTPFDALSIAHHWPLPGKATPGHPLPLLPRRGPEYSRARLALPVAS